MGAGILLSPVCLDFYDPDSNIGPNNCTEQLRTEVAGVTGKIKHAGW